MKFYFKNKQYTIHKGDLITNYVSIHITDIHHPKVYPYDNILIISADRLYFTYDCKCIFILNIKYDKFIGYADRKFYVLYDNSIYSDDGKLHVTNHDVLLYYAGGVSLNNKLYYATHKDVLKLYDLQGLINTFNITPTSDIFIHNNNICVEINDKNIILLNG